MTESHTAGPWTWGRNYNGLTGATGEDVLHYEPYEGMWLGFESQKANARLIAAAPDMLAALRLIAETDYVDAALDPQRAVRVAQEVIAKATGISHD